MTRSKLLEQVKLIADGKTAFAKNGASTALILADGAGKLQTADASTGTFVDYADLVDGNNNVDISGAKAYLKVITSSSAVVALGDCYTDPVA